MLRRDALNNLGEVRQSESKRAINNVFVSDALSVKTIQGNTKLIGQSKKRGRENTKQFLYRNPGRYPLIESKGFKSKSKPNTNFLHNYNNIFYQTF